MVLSVVIVRKMKKEVILNKEALDWYFAKTGVSFNDIYMVI